jgi:hypothetical protein
MKSAFAICVAVAVAGSASAQPTQSGIYYGDTSNFISGGHSVARGTKVNCPYDHTICYGLDGNMITLNADGTYKVDGPMVDWVARLNRPIREGMDSSVSETRRLRTWFNSGAHSSHDCNKEQKWLY